MKTKFFLFTLVVAFAAFALIACENKSSAPANGYEGTWNVIDTQYYSGFYKTVVISKDSMIATARIDNARYNYHYRVVKDSVIKLERTFLQNPERSDYTEEVNIYFDANKHLVIENFSIGDLTQVFPPVYLPVMLEKL